MKYPDFIRYICDALKVAKLAKVIVAIIKNLIEILG